jgi:tetratricopeptide (TPR) repeat protein
MLHDATLHVCHRPPARRSGKRWCLDLALLRDPAFPEAFESAAILDEVRGDLGLVLWQISRDVLLWASAGPEQRAGLFAVQEPVSADATDELLHETVRELSGTLLKNGCEGEAKRVVDCCRTVARWAVNAGLERTALAFAQAAAAASAGDAGRYVDAGRLLVRYRRRTAAETWFRRGIALARRAGDWGSYAEAWLELGWLHASQGATENATFALKRALKVSARHGVRHVRARAHYGMMRVLSAVADYEAARRHGAMSLRWYGGHREHTGVTHELAALMMEQDPVANASECSKMLRSVLPLRRSGADRIATLTLLVRAAGYAGQDAIVADAWFDAARAIDGLGASPDAAHRLLDLARAGCDTRMDTARVAEVARLAFHMAVRVDDRPLAQDAEAFRLELLRT